MHTFNIDLNSYTDPIIDGINHTLPRVPTLLLALLIGILLIRVVVRLLRFTLGLTTMQPGLRDVLTSVTEISLWLFLMIKILEMIGFQNIIVLFTGSIAALGLAMAAGGSTLVSDIVAGLFLAQDMDFEVGDEVIVGETPTQGVIESMDARRVRVRDKDGILHIIPNSIVERKEWVLVHRRQEISALARAVKTAKKIRRTAIAKTAAIRKNDQSPE